MEQCLASALEPFASCACVGKDVNKKMQGEESYAEKAAYWVARRDQTLT